MVCYALFLSLRAEGKSIIIMSSTTITFSPDSSWLSDKRTTPQIKSINQKKDILVYLCAAPFPFIDIGTSLPC